MQGLIEWCLENAYYEKPFCQDPYLVIEFDSLRSKFDKLKEKEKKQIIDACNSGFNGIAHYKDLTVGENYYENKYGS